MRFWFSQNDFLQATRTICANYSQGNQVPFGEIIINNNKLQIYIAQFPWRDDQLRITTIHGIK